MKKLEQVYLYISNSNYDADLTLDDIKVHKLLSTTQAECVLTSKELAANSIFISDDASLIKMTNMPFLIYIHSGNMGQSLPQGAFCVELLEDIDSDYLIRAFERYHKIPWKILETDRLEIVEEAVEDVPRLKELYRDVEVTKYMENLFELEEEKEYTRNYIKNVYEFYGFGMWLIKLKSTGEIIGRAGVEAKGGFDGLELGFMLGKDYWHHGYAFEACKAVLDYSNENLECHNFKALVHKDNTASKKLCERLGFEITGEENNFYDYRRIEK